MPRRRSHARIVWSGAEKQELIARAEQIQRARPDLAGLPLLRAAIRSLPENRRRRVITLAQTPWFETGLQRQAQITAAAEHTHLESDVGEIKTLVRQIVDILRSWLTRRPSP